MKKIVTGILAGAFILGMSTSAFAATFTDVPTSHWAYSSIENMATKGVVNGVGQGKFAPADKILSTEFVTMVVRSYYADDVDLNDTELGWWEPYVNAADENELLSSIMLNETKPFTRTEMAQLIYNLIKNQNMTMPTSAEIENAKKQIPDISSVEEFYQTAVATVYQLGYLKGLDSTGRFGGNETMDRAQACAVMERLLNGVKYVSPQEMATATSFTTYFYDNQNECITTDTQKDITLTLYADVAKKNPDGLYTGESVTVKENNGNVRVKTGLNSLAMGNYKMISTDETVVKVDSLGNIYSTFVSTAERPNATAKIIVYKNGEQSSVTVNVGKPKDPYEDAEYMIPDNDYLTRYSAEMLRLVNEARAEAGVAALVYDDSLQKFANARAIELSENFDHINHEGTLSAKLVKKYNLNYAENASVSPFNSNPEQFAQEHFESWMDSLGHKHNILSSLSSNICLSLSTNGQGAYLVQIFTQ